MYNKNKNLAHLRMHFVPQTLKPGYGTFGLESSPSVRYVVLWKGGVSEPMLEIAFSFHPPRLKPCKIL